jgi:type IV secretion system protein VirB11
MARHHDAAAVLRGQLEPLGAILARSDVFEIAINRPGEVWVEMAAGWTQTLMAGLSFEALLRLARTVASYSAQSIDERTPILSASLPDGERIQIVLPPATPPGVMSMTIRKPSALVLSLDALRQAGLFSAVQTSTTVSPVPAIDGQLSAHLRAGAVGEFLAGCVLAKKTIIISGATGSGKTTLSKALVQMIPMHERIITIEDTLELDIPQPNHVRLLYSKGGQGASAVGARDLLESCLRMRPDRILLQELRDATAFDYLRTVNSGHPGSITTVHANSCPLALEQLTLLVKESAAGRNLPRGDIRELLEQLVDVVLQCERVAGQFRVTDIWFRADAAQRNRPAIQAA